MRIVLWVVLLVTAVVLAGMPAAMAVDPWGAPVPVPVDPGPLRFHSLASWGTEMRLSWELLTSIDPMPRQVARSSDGGASFRTLPLPEGALPIGPTFVAARPQGGFAYLLSMGDAGDLVIAAVEAAPGEVELVGPVTLLQPTRAPVGLAAGPGGLLAVYPGFEADVRTNRTVFRVLVSAEGREWRESPLPLRGLEETLTFLDLEATTDAFYILFYERDDAHFAGTPGRFVVARTEDPWNGSWQRATVATAEAGFFPGGSLAVSPTGGLAVAWSETFRWRWTAMASLGGQVGSPADFPFSAFGRPDLGRRVELAYDGGGRLHASWWDWIMVLQGDVAFDAPAVLHAEMEEGDWSNPEEVHRPTAFVSPDDLPTEILLGTDVLRSPIIVWRDHTAAEASLARGHVSGLVVLGLAPGATLSGPVAVHGTTPPGTTVQVRIDNGPWATAEGSPDWRVQVDGAAVPVGEHTLEVRVCTSEGYCSAPESIPFRTASLLFLLVLLAIGVAVVVGLVALARRTLRATRSTRRHKT